MLIYHKDPRHYKISRTLLSIRMLHRVPVITHIYTVTGIITLLLIPDQPELVQLEMVHYTFSLLAHAQLLTLTEWTRESFITLTHSTDQFTLTHCTHCAVSDLCGKQYKLEMVVMVKSLAIIYCNRLLCKWHVINLQNVMITVHQRQKLCQC